MMTSLLVTSCYSVPPIKKINTKPDLLQQANLPNVYRVAPGDLLQVKVFQVDDLERQVRVDRDGHVSLPLIGSIEAAGHSAEELETMIANLYRQTYLQNPQVSVLVQEANANRVTVSGAVTEPGIYPINGANLTLQQALAQAKGTNQVASRRNVIVFRTIDGQKMLARFDLTQIEQGKLVDPQIYGGDIVVVYRSDAQVFLRTVLELTPFVMVWRAYR